MNFRRNTLPHNLAFAVLAALLALRLQSIAQTIDPHYAANYSLRSLGEVPNLPYRYGGLVFRPGDPNTLLIGGNANTDSAQLFQIALVRDATHHITGYNGVASYYANANGLPNSGGGIDGGLICGPGNVLLYTSYKDNSLGEIMPGHSTISKQIDLTPLGVDTSVGSLVLVPPGLPGAGRLKILSYNTSGWYDTTLSPDGSGTFDLAPISTPIYLGGIGVEGAFYVAAGNPLFPKPSVLVADYSDEKIISFEIDANGDPLPDTQRDFVTGASSVEGAAKDPLTGDFVFSSFSAGQVWIVGGFGIAAPTVSITSPQNGASFSPPAEFQVSANAAQPGGAIDEVDFYLDNQYLGRDTAEVPYTLTLYNVSPGTHELMAVAYGSGLCTTSSVVRITVGNLPPTVAIVSPAQNTLKNECADLLLAAVANSAYGSVTNVAYYLNGSTLLGSVTHPPYLLVVSLPTGANNLTAVATDDSGSNSTSAPVRVVFTITPSNAMCASLLTSGQVKLCFRGLANRSYVFEAAPSLSAPSWWIPFATNQAPANQNGLLDALAPFPPQGLEQFYRARLLP
jgi:hypothetical protein